VRKTSYEYDQFLKIEKCIFEGNDFFVFSIPSANYIEVVCIPEDYYCPYNDYPSRETRTYRMHHFSKRKVLAPNFLERIFGITYEEKIKRAIEIVKGKHLSTIEKKDREEKREDRNELKRKQNAALLKTVEK
jgi:hypothetical protein